MASDSSSGFVPAFLSEGSARNASALDSDFWATLQHPDDRQAIRAMEAIPALSAVSRFIQDQAIEKFARAQLIGDAIRLGPKQLPHIHALLAEVCGTLRMEKVPEFYLKMERTPNAYTIGEKNPLVQITSGLLEILPENDIKTVLAHECGHILFKHTRYTLAAKVVLNGANSTLGTMANYAALGSLTALKEAIYRWERMSELSADRVSMIYAGSISAAIRVQLLLAGGLRSIPDEINVEEYVRQSEDFVEMFKPDKVTGWLANLTLMSKDHPYASSRCVELAAFAKGTAFKVASRRLGTFRCPTCGGRMRTDSLCENGHFC